jgi:chemotaxis protein MotB
MATYADMVTLLFCFFVMLYAAASTDENKVQYILQSFRTDGSFINTVVGRQPDEPEPVKSDGNADTLPPTNPGDQQANPEGQTDRPYLFENLFSALADVSEENELDDVMNIFAAPGMIRIQLKSDIMFAPDSFELRPEGRRALDLISPAIRATQEYIALVQIQGHTADVGRPNTGINDWDLSSRRAASVTIYLDEEKGMVASEKFRAEGFGNNDPLYSNDDIEGRAWNRRVEIVINRNDVSPDIDRLMNDIMAHDYNQPHFSVDAMGGTMESGIPYGTVVAGILGSMADRYGEREPDRQPDVIPGQPAGPSPGGFIDLNENDFGTPLEIPELGEDGEPIEE